MRAFYDALHEVYPFPEDTRIFLREWARDSVSQGGLLGSEPARPVLVLHVAIGGDAGAKRTMVQRINAALTDAYGLPDFAVFFLEHSLDTVAINGRLLADDEQRVTDQTEAYS